MEASFLCMLSCKYEWRTFPAENNKFCLEVKRRGDVMINKQEQKLEWPNLYISRWALCVPSEINEGEKMKK